MDGRLMTRVMWCRGGHSGWQNVRLIRNVFNDKINYIIEDA